MKNFDIIIVGGGHAGIEAANIASQFDLKVAIVSMPGVALASAPCNPAVGGVGKGQVVRELDALGGIMGRLADLSGIQYRTLNESKGYAVQSTRIQIDKVAYSKIAEDILSSNKNLQIIYDKVIDISKTPEGFAVTAESDIYSCSKVILTVGTFLNGKLHTGENSESGGRIDCKASSGLADILKSVPTNPKRFKTGTPPRILASSINYDVLEEQPSDDSVVNFHFNHEEGKRFKNQVSCFLARTNQQTIDIIAKNKERSPMYNGSMQAIGARYCPSIEDKVHRYPDKSNHHIFVEPESLELNTVYPSGISSSLPSEVQEQYVHSIDGFEDAKIEIYGYAVEYDVVDTTLLTYGLEHKNVDGLYLAGQVNGTSGYEEAAAQGFIAGVNAAIAIKKCIDDLFILNRDESYIGVMIEDLITVQRDEPYRLFTARSENRLYCREDNAIIRMNKYRSKLNLDLDVDNHNDRFCSEFFALSNILDNTFVDSNDDLVIHLSLHVPRRTSLSEILKMNGLDPVKSLELMCDFMGLSYSHRLIRAVAISKKYEGYINKEKTKTDKVKKLDSQKIDWKELCNSENVSFECKQRIKKVQPVSFGQLKKIPGIRRSTLTAIASSL